MTSIGPAIDTLPREAVGESCDGSSFASPRPRGGRGAGGLSGGGAIQWLWSLRRLWEAAIRRHSDRTAALPLRWKRSIRRLPSIWPNTGSMLYALPGCY